MAWLSQEPAPPLILDVGPRSEPLCRTPPRCKCRQGQQGVQGPVPRCAGSARAPLGAYGLEHRKCRLFRRRPVTRYNVDMATDTGAHLRSLYVEQGGVARIFSRKVADYIASRPDYPAALYDRLQLEAELAPQSHIADVGAGTGLLTRGLLERGYRVVAVEPNTEMREAADHLLGRFPSYRSVAGMGESMTIESGSVDLVTVAHAFHWFEPGKARDECLRVLRARGKVALIWNDRVLTDPLHVALDEVLSQYGGVKRNALVAHEERGDVPRFFGRNPPKELALPHEHWLDEDGLVSLVFSRSYMPSRESSEGAKVRHLVRQIFGQHAQEGRVSVRYTTVAYIGRPGEREA